METLPLKKIFGHSSITAYADDPQGIIWTKQIGVFNPEIMIESMKTQIAYLPKLNSLVATVVDLRLGKGTFTKVNDYADKEYVPAMSKAGLKYAAIILNESDIFMRYAVNTALVFAGKSQFKAETKAFNSQEKAIKWLSEKMNKEVIIPQEMK